MEKEIDKLFNEAIRLELQVADLYMIFYNTHKEDSEFWWKLVLEEKGHASILETAQGFYFSNIEGSTEILPSKVDELVKINEILSSLIKELKMEPPSRMKAFEIAHEIEISAGESHFQNAMDIKEHNLQIWDILKRLNKDDKDHAKRIREYMKGIN